jgi:hypothetical protein
MPAAQQTRIWRGYQTLLMRSELVGSAGALALAGALGPGVADEQTSVVDFWSFTGLDSVSIAGLDARIDPRDPRHDAYMDRVRGYFSPLGDAWRVAYIPARLPSARVFLRLALRLGFPLPGSWRLAEFDPVEKALSLLGLFGFALLLAGSINSSRRAGLALAGTAAILWAPYVLCGGIDRLALALVSLLPWSQLMKTLVVLHGWDEKLVRETRPWLAMQAAVAGLGLTLQSLLTGPSLMPIISYVPPLAASLLLLAGIAGIWGKAMRSKKRRAKYAPIPIVRPVGEPPRVRFAAIFFAVACLVGTALVPLARGASLPTPIPLIGTRAFSWQAVVRLSREARAQRLPDFSDLVFHEALQEGMAFGRSARMPAPDERVYVRTYAADGTTGVVTARLVRAKTFDAAWLRSVLGRSEPGSVGALLEAQGRPAAVAIRGPFRSTLRELLAVLIAAAALLATLRTDPALQPLIQGVLLRFNDIARRNQIP